MIFAVVKGKPDRAMYDFSRTRDFRKKVVSNFRYLLFIKSDEAFCSCHLCDCVLQVLSECISLYIPLKCYLKEPIAVQAEQQPSEIA